MSDRNRALITLLFVLLALYITQLDFAGGIKLGLFFMCVFGIIYTLTGATLAQMKDECINAMHNWRRLLMW